VLKELKKVNSCEEAVERLRGKKYAGELDKETLKKKNQRRDKGACVLFCDKKQNENVKGF
jgi:hypothetical protein